MKSGILFSFVAAALTASADIAVSNVKITQDWPWSNKVTVTYNLEGVSEFSPGEVVVKAYGNGNEIPMQASGLKGDIYNLKEDGLKTITIDPVRAFGKGVELIPSFKVSITARSVTEASTDVIYKIFDLNEKTVTDVTRGDLLNGKYGTVETDFGAIGEGYTTTLDDVIIWTGVTNDIAYKTTKLVLRKIPAGDFKGYVPDADIPASKNMTWTFDYWIGVFELTQKQRSIIRTGDQNKPPEFLGDTLPDHNLQNYYLYGCQQGRNATTNETTGVYGLFHYLRKMFKNGEDFPYDFELPTQVQWVRAMRAGAESYYYDGLINPINVTSNDQYSVLANYVHNGGLVSNLDGTVTTNLMEVGHFRPNAYGLYDTLGNVREYVREADYTMATHINIFNTTAGTNCVSVAGASNHTVTYGGAFNEHGKGFYPYTIQTHSSKGGVPYAGVRVCMQSMDDGVELMKLFNK